MRVIEARNVNDAYYAGAHLITHVGRQFDSRNGPVVRVIGPVATVYQNPVERVLFDERRNANPFFHLFEALWMLNGGQDVETMDQFLASFKQFSDDGVTFHGAYGHRWRHWPDYTSGQPYTKEIDQLTQVIGMLGLNQNDRRAVICMWDPARDLAIQSNDIPCNDLINLEVVDGKLNMMVTCRSNDIIFGCYGANAVHFSMLFEYLAAHIGVLFGTLTQVSWNFHAYLKTPYNLGDFYPPLVHLDNPYTLEDDERPVAVHPLVGNRETFDRELHDVMEEVRQHSFDDADLSSYTNPFFVHIAQPMYRAFMQYKVDNNLDAAIGTLQEAASLHPVDFDWLLAGENWLQRIADKRAVKSHPVSIAGCSACGKDHESVSTRPPTKEEADQGIHAVVVCPDTGTDVFVKVDPNPDGEAAPKQTHRFAPKAPEEREVSRR